MNFSDKTLHLTYDEFYVLMCLFGAKNVGGTFVENYHNISPNDFDNMWINCKKTLSAKEYMTSDDEEVQLDISLYCMLSECVKAHKKYNVQLSNNKNIVINTMFYDRTNSIICVDNCTENGEVYLSYRSKKRVLTDIINAIPKASDSAIQENVPEINFSTQEYFTLISDVNMKEYTKALQLFPDDFPEEYASDLMNALTNSYGVLSVNEFGEDEISHYSTLFGKLFYWTIYAEDNETISFKPISRKDLENALTQTFDYSGGDI